MVKSVTPWFENEPSVFEEEKIGLEALGFVLDKTAFDRDRAVVFSGRSTADPLRELKVIYPSGFPSFPPDVLDDGSQRLLSRHQHPNRAFCLFGPDRVDWVSSMNGTDAVSYAEKLIRDYPPNSAPLLDNEVPEPVSDLLPNSELGGFLVPPEIVSLAGKLPAAAVGECRLVIGNQEPKRGVILSAKFKGQAADSAAIYQHVLAGQVINAPLIWLAKTPPLFSQQIGPGAWLHELPQAFRPDPKRRWIVFCYPEESRTAKQTDVAFTIFHVQGEKYQCYRGFALSAERVFTRIPGLEALATKRVVILGLGALGSRIAVCLAASGVRYFHLLDRDVYDPANAVRHECGFPSFGLPKCHVVANRMKQANAHIEWTIALARIGSLAPEQEADLMEQITRADLIIDATGSEIAGHWIHRRCQMLRKTCLHAAVANGAWSGEVIRAIPDETPCWICHHVGNAPGPAEPSLPGGHFAAGCAHPTFTGTMPEVSIVADLAAAMAIETLLKRSGKDFTGSHLQWSSRNSDGRCDPRINVTTPLARPECSVCPPKLKPQGTSS